MHCAFCGVRDIHVSLKEDIDDCRKEKDSGKADRSVEDYFFESALCPVDISFASEGCRKTRSALLQQNCRYKQNGYDYLDIW